MLPAHLHDFDPGADYADPLLEILDAPWVAVGERNYPPHYFYALGRYPVHAAAIERMRRALAGTPRLNPADYDILFNSVTQQWDIVKWCPMPEPVGALGGYGHMTRVVLEPIDVYSIPARERDPFSLGEADWTFLRARCVTTRGGQVVNDEIEENNHAALAALEAEREAAEHDLAGWMRGLLRKLNDETGYGDLSPEEMARRTGTPVSEWELAER